MINSESSYRCTFIMKDSEKEEVGIEPLLKEYVKIKDHNKLISKDNLTDADK